MRRTILASVLLGGVAVGPALAQNAAPIAEDLESVTAAPHDERAHVPPVLEGRVVAVDRERGRFVLATDAGAITLATTPGEVSTMEVGDVVVVGLDDVDGESGL